MAVLEDLVALRTLVWGPEDEQGIEEEFEGHAARIREVICV